MWVKYISAHVNTDDSWEFVQEDLTRRELLQIANEINPDRGHSLSSIIHHSTHVWTEISHLHPPLSPRDKIFSVLERWFENVSESPENRRTLANACRRVEQLRVASRIARKSYVTSWHIFSAQTNDSSFSAVVFCRDLHDVVTPPAGYILHATHLAR